MNKTTKRVVPFFLLTTGLANIAIYCSAGNSLYGLLFNSDALYLPTLFSDVLSKGGNITDWFLTPAPYFIPDYITFFPAYLISNEPYIQILAFALIQVVFTFFAIWLIAKAMHVNNAFIAALAVSVLLIWLALEGGSPFPFLLVSAHHYGTFIASIVFIALWHLYKEQQSSRTRYFILSLLSALSFLLTLSDSLFIVWVITPLVATVALFSLVDRNYSLASKLPLLLILAFSLAGFFLYDSIVANPTRYVIDLGVGQISSNLTVIYGVVYNAVQTPIFGFLLLLYLMTVVYALFTLTRDATADRNLSWISIFSLLSIIPMVSVEALVTNQLVATRYFIPSFSWPIIVVILFLGRFLRRSFPVIVVMFSALLLISLSASAYTLIKENGVATNYYPSEIACIDRVLKTADVISGIAGYWDAKHIQAFSRQNITIAQYWGSLNEKRWITTKDYFKTNYGFAIVSNDPNAAYNIPSELLVRINGSPKRIAKCGDESIYVYGKSNLRVRKVVNIGDSYTWRACELPTRIGLPIPGCSMRKEDVSESGYVTFGPYAQLPVGKYVFDISYSSASENTDIIGTWDVALALPDKAEIKILNKRDLLGTNGAIEEIKGQFDVTPKQDMKRFEIRTFARKNTHLEVHYIRVTRVE